MSSTQKRAIKRRRAAPRAARRGERTDTSSVAQDEASLAAINRASGDDLRLRILRLLARDSFAVQELCELCDVAQPALSHHLKILLNAGLLARRREGTSVFYQRVSQHRAFPELVGSLFSALDGLPVDTAQQRAVADLHAGRRQRGLEFFAANAESLSAQRTRICAPETYADSAAELIDRADLASCQRALEVGPGEGQLLKVLAQRFDAVLGIDSSERMLRQARGVLQDVPNARLKLRDFADLPAQRRYQAVAAAMVLHHQPSPQAFIEQAARVIKPGGVFVLVDLCRHDQEWVRDACGDFWLGFEPDELLSWGRTAGFAKPVSQYLTQNNGFQVQLHAFRRAAAA